MFSMLAVEIGLGEIRENLVLTFCAHTRLRVRLRSPYPCQKRRIPASRRYWYNVLNEILSNEINRLRIHDYR